jgi:anaerobic ribonucleoside-triphosphate reductase
MDRCTVCGKELKPKEGIASSTGILVCSEECKQKYLETLPNRGKSPLVVYSRVTGYITPVNAWNKGKLREHQDRRLYTVDGGLAK